MESVFEKYGNMIEHLSADEIHDYLHEAIEQFPEEVRIAITCSLLQVAVEILTDTNDVTEVMPGVAEGLGLLMIGVPGFESLLSIATAQRYRSAIEKKGVDPSEAIPALRERLRELKHRR